MAPEKHALLSASSASRWLVCTAAPRFEEGMPERTSADAEHGRIVHEICELKVLKKSTVMTNRAYGSRLKKLIKKEIDFVEAFNANNSRKLEISGDKCSDIYLEYINELVMGYDSAPNVAVEVQVDFSAYVPEGFGTCDCCIIGGDTLSIVDYKHGKGVPVAAKGNPQMRLYALGALNRYAPIFGNTIKNVRMSIMQPRLDPEPSTDLITVDELLAWGDSIKPIASKAFSGFGEFVPGDHCRFCRGKAKCRARANTCTALEDFAGCVPEGSLAPEQKQSMEAATASGMEAPGLLTDEEIGELLIRGKSLVQWYKDLEEYATQTLLDGKPIPGWKLVAGRSNRAFTDQDAAIKAVIAAGYDEALVYDRKPKTLSQLEELMGKKEFKEKIGSFVVKPLGKPTLAEAADKREAYNPAAADFASAVPE